MNSGEFQKISNGENVLSNISYIELIKLVKKNNMMKYNKEMNIIMGIHNTCEKVVKSLSGNLFENLSINESRKPLSVSCNFRNLPAEETCIREFECFLKKNLFADLEYNLKEKTIRQSTVEEMDEVSKNMNYSYKNSFCNERLKLRKMRYLSSLQTNEKQSVLRQDTVMVSHDKKGMLEDINSSVKKFYLHKYKDDNACDYLMEKIDQAEISKKVSNYIFTLKCGYVKRTAQFLYLNFLRDILLKKGFNESIKYRQSYKLFSNYVDRFLKLEAMLQDTIVNGRSEEYVIKYMNKDVDILYLLRIENVYDFLPFIGKISCALADTASEDRGQGHEIYGISSKLNGRVATSGKNSIEFQMEKINNLCSKRTATLKTKDTNYLGYELVNALLMKFFTVSLENNEYNAVNEFIKDIEKIKDNLNSEDEVVASIQYINGFIENSRGDILKHISLIKSMLQDSLNVDDKIYSKEYTRYFSVLPGMLPRDLYDFEKGENITQSNGFNTKFVKFTTLFENANEKSIYNYKYTFKYDSNILESLLGEEEEYWNIRYVHKIMKGVNICFLPNIISMECNGDVVSLHPMINKKKKNVSKAYSCNKDALYIEYAENYSLYAKDDAECVKKRAIYELTYSIITASLISAYLSKICEINNVSQSFSSYKKLYVALTQIHFKGLNGKDFSRSQEYVKVLRRSISRALNSKYTCETQGFDIDKTGGAAKGAYKNAINSLYSKVLKFIDRPFSVKKKIAIISITSYKSDTSALNKNIYKAMIYGDVICLNGDSANNGVYMSHYKSFNEYTDNNSIFEKSRFLKDIIKELYKIGYREIVYVASAPYTTNMFEKVDKTELYFMNESFINEIGDFDRNIGLSIYPLYFNTMNVYQSKGSDDVTLCLSDTAHISHHLYDNTSGIKPVFQLYSGLTVNEGEDNYNTLIIYCTPSGMYKNQALNRSIEVLFEKSECKDDVVQALIYYHSMMFEKSNIRYKMVNGKKEYINNINIKINPYEKLMGVDGIGKRARRSYYYNKAKTDLSTGFTVNYYGLCEFIIKSINKEFMGSEEK